MASSLPPPPVYYPVSWRQAAVQSPSSNFLLNVDAPHKEPSRPGGRLSIWTSHVLGDKKPFYPLKPTTPPKNYSWPAHSNSQYLPQLQFLLSPHSTGLMVTSLLKEGALRFQSSLVVLYSESHIKINLRSFSSSSQSLVKCWRDHCL